MIKSFFDNIFMTNQSSKKEELKHFILGTSLIQTLDQDSDSILFGCGCFWGAEKAFWKLPGVITTSVGYSGGNLLNPSYKQVCSGTTGHAEVVQVVWNKSKIDLSDLLKLFWECHDPTQGNRQGNDYGSQYRSAIYTNDEFQNKISLATREFYQNRLKNHGYGDITTEITTKKNYYLAEEYHQQYLARPFNRPYCSAMPTKVTLGEFPGSNYLLKDEIWKNYNWKINHCVLRTSNEPI